VCQKTNTELKEITVVMDELELIPGADEDLRESCLRTSGCQSIPFYWKRLAAEYWLERDPSWLCD
jgi:hypothetical protein